MKKPSNQVVGNIGMYFVCHKLSLMGWNVMPTARNARGIDIVVYGDSCDEFFGIQVKALSKRDPVPLGNSLDNIMGDYWIIVNNAVNDKCAAFVMKPDKVKQLAQRSKKKDKSGKFSYWLQPTTYDTDEFKEKWCTIGRDGSNQTLNA